MCISLYRLLTVESRDLISSSRDSVSGFVSAFGNGRVRSYFSVAAAHGPELVTTRFDRPSSPVVYERPARSVGLPGFAVITAPVLTFLFTGRDACDHSE